MSQVSAEVEETGWLLASASRLEDFYCVPLYGLLAVACCLLCLKLLLLSTHRGLPPGPWGLPVFGVLPRMGRRPHLTVQRWWEQYGDIVCVYMGSRLVIILNGIEIMKECFVRQGDVFSGRPWNYLKKITKGKGLVFSEGDVWREHRRFTLGCLRDFGMGKVVIEEKVLEEAIYLKEVIDGFDGRPFDPAEWISKAVSNIISSVIYGSRFDYSDPVFLTNLSALSQSTRNQTLISLINFLPILEFLPKVLPKDKMLQRNVRLRQEYAQAQLASHRESFDRENPRDFIDVYLARMEELKGRGDETTFDESQLERAIQDLFIAGTESVSVTLRWTFLFMALNQQVQAKVHDELDRFVGSARMPTRQDRPLLPYTEATILECQRLGNVALFSVPRCTTADTQVAGYRIPKGTWVFANRWGLHSSERYWNDPEQLRPENFLNLDGRVKQPEAFAPFGLGSRSCLGSSLAQTEIFIFFTSVLQSFTLQLPSDRPPPNLEPSAGLNMAPQPYELLAIRR